MRWVACALLWLVSVSAALVSAKSYGAPISISLVAAVAYCVRVYELWREGTTLTRAVIGIATALLAVLTLDTLSRALHILSKMLGCP